MVRAILIVGVGCAGAEEPAPPRAAPDAPAVAPRGSAPDAALPGGVLTGSCEASALVPWQGGWLVGDNENTVALLRYGADFAPAGTLPLSPEIDDIEALATRDDGVLVVGSHSANRQGKARPARERLRFPDGRVVSLDLTACPACAAARGRAPDDGGFNVEAAAWAGESLLLGLRAPLAASGAALLLTADATGRVTAVTEVNLGGLAFRDLAPAPGGGLYAVAGPVADGDAPFGLWRLGASGEPPVRLLDLPSSTEGIAVDPADPARLLYVTDGDGKPGAPCAEPARWGSVRLPG